MYLHISCIWSLLSYHDKRCYLICNKLLIHNYNAYTETFILNMTSFCEPRKLRKNWNFGLIRDNTNMLEAVRDIFSDVRLLGIVANEWTDAIERELGIVRLTSKAPHLPGCALSPLCRYHRGDHCAGRGGHPAAVPSQSHRPAASTPRRPVPQRNACCGWWWSGGVCEVPPQLWLLQVWCGGEVFQTWCSGCTDCD